MLLQRVQTTLKILKCLRVSIKERKLFSNVITLVKILTWTCPSPVTEQCGLTWKSSGQRTAKQLLFASAFGFLNFYTLLLFFIRWPVGIIDYWLCGFDWWYVCFRTARVSATTLNATSTVRSFSLNFSQRSGWRFQLNVRWCSEHTHERSSTELISPRPNNAGQSFYWTAHKMFSLPFLCFSREQKRSRSLAKLLCEQELTHPPSL